MNPLRAAASLPTLYVSSSRRRACRFHLRARRTAVAGEANPVDHLYSDLNLAQIAHERGFGEVCYFNRVFRHHFGAAPCDFDETARLKWLT
jgi:AraC-like DNA-binding protein